MKEYELFKQTVRIIIEAGDAIMDIYSGDIDVELKDDQSPLTAADKAAHDVITAGLADVEFRGRKIPVISEEGAMPDYEDRKSWDYFWLIDPLDGTKEFIKRNGEFTVNIALIENDSPMLGIVYVPVKKTLYFGGKDIGSFKTDDSDTDLEHAKQLPLDGEASEGVLRAVGSRSHRTAEFDEWVQAEAERRGCSSIDIVTAGSSLKFCLAAEGLADVYPRFGPTMEWDTGAAQAVAEGAGKTCTQPDGSRMYYNKKIMKNFGFIVS